MYNTGDPIGDAAVYYYGDENQSNMMHKCEFDGNYYDEDKMTFDGEFWVANENLIKWKEYINL